MSTSAYDGFYNLLSPEEKQLLLDNIRKIGDKFYNEYVNHLENRIADNHVWQMTFRILTMAAFATVSEIPEASVWTDYCYNEWISRLPGLHKDGGWHNGDAYFHVNIRTLIEVPAFSHAYPASTSLQIRGITTMPYMLSISNLPSPNPEVMATHMKDNAARTEGA